MTFHFSPSVLWDDLSSLSLRRLVCVCTNPRTHAYVCTENPAGVHLSMNTLTISLIHIYTQAHTSIQLATYQNINSSFSQSEPCSPRPFYNTKSASWISHPASEGFSIARHDGLCPFYCQAFSCYVCHCMAAMTAINENQQKHLLTGYIGLGWSRAQPSTYAYTLLCQGDA